MPVVCQGREIRRVLVVDDDPDGRKSLGYSIEDSGMEPINEQGPLENLTSFVKQIPAKAEAVFSDYRLKPTNYSAFNGDELVAACYTAHIPAILCTGYNNTDFMLDRGLVRRIPVLLHTREPHPDEIEPALLKCVSELEGKLPPSRRPWRTLVRVHEVDMERHFFYVILPGWNVREKIPLEIRSVPEEIQKNLSPGKRFHAQVNIGAESFNELYFDEWEPE